MRRFANKHDHNHLWYLEITGNGLELCGVALGALYGGQPRRCTWGFPDVSLAQFPTFFVPTTGLWGKVGSNFMSEKKDGVDRKRNGFRR